MGAFEVLTAVVMKSTIRWFKYDRDRFFFLKTIIAKHLHMSVFNALPSGVNTFFPTFWKHPDALFKKGLWLAAYPLPNSLDDCVVVRKPHALQV
jgi:hypothetical protein